MAMLLELRRALRRDRAHVQGATRCQDREALEVAGRLVQQNPAGFLGPGAGDQSALPFAAAAEPQQWVYGMAEREASETQDALLLTAVENAQPLAMPQAVVRRRRPPPPHRSSTSSREGRRC